MRAMMERPRVEALPDPASPYFAHLRVKEGETVRDYCLGRTTFVDIASGVRVVDWRWAPVARLFYRYREGDAYEERFPGRLAEGIVLARRVVVVQGGEIVAHLHSDPLALSRRGRGVALLARRRGRVARRRRRDGGPSGLPRRRGRSRRRAARAEVTALLDPEQFEAPAGGGRRAAPRRGQRRQRQDHGGASSAGARWPSTTRGAFPAPAAGGGAGARAGATTGPSARAARAWQGGGPHARSWARGAFQSRSACHRPGSSDETPSLVSRLKRHPALYEALRRRPHRRRARPRPPGSACAPSSASSSPTAPSFDGGTRPPRGELPSTAIEETLRHTRLQMRPRPPSLRARRGPGPAPGTRRRAGGGAHARGAGRAPSTRRTCPSCSSCLPRGGDGGHAAPRTSWWTRRRTSRSSSCSCSDASSASGRSLTLAGDEDQQTTSAFGGWTRCSRPSAPSVLPPAGSDHLPLPRTGGRSRAGGLGTARARGPAAGGRPGVPVGRFDFPTEAHAHLFVAGAVRDLLEREPAGLGGGRVARAGGGAKPAPAARRPRRGQARPRRGLLLPARCRPDRRGEREGPRVRLRDRPGRLGERLPCRSTSRVAGCTSRSRAPLTSSGSPRSAPLRPSSPW